jgi:hypothetical protein
VIFIVLQFSSSDSDYSNILEINYFEINSWFGILDFNNPAACQKHLESSFLPTIFRNFQKAAERPLPRFLCEIRWGKVHPPLEESY